jgi:hypothetical protein
MNISAEIRWFWRDAPPPGVREWFCDARAHGMPAGGGATRVDWYVTDPAQPELGIKRRGVPGASADPNAARVESGSALVEVKGLVAREFGTLAADPFSGPLELWSKWRTEALTLQDAPLIRTAKRRWLRTFDTTAAAAAAATATKGAATTPAATAAAATAAAATAAATAVEIELDAREKPVSGERLDAGCGVELTEVTLAAGTWWTLGFEAFGPLESLAASVGATAQLLVARRPPLLVGGRRSSYPEWLAREG